MHMKLVFRNYTDVFTKMRTWFYSIAYIPCLSVSFRYKNQFFEKIVNTYNVDANKYAWASLSGYEQ